MESLAHKSMNLRGGYATDRRPALEEFTGLNWDSQHAQDLLACWPMWGPPGADVIVDLTPYNVKAYQVNEGTDPYVFDDQFGWVYQGDNGGVPHGGGAPTKSSGYRVLTYPQHLDRGYVTTAGTTAKSISFTVWYRALDRNGQLIKASDFEQAGVGGNNPPNSYFLTFDSPANSFPGFGFALSCDQAINAIFGELDIDGGNSQSSTIGQFADLSDGKWHHITGVYQVPNPAAADAGGVWQGHMFLYIDGLVDVSDANGAPGGGLELVPAMASVLDVTGNGTWKFYIGVDDDGKAAPMNGRFCDLRIYGTDLTPSEALHMWSPDTRWELYRPKRSFRVFNVAASFTATGTPSVGHATTSGSATFSPGTHTASSSPSVGHATAAANATFAAPVYTGTGACTIGHATASAAATFAPGTHTASGSPSAAPATVSAAATFAPGTKTASGTPSVGHATTSGSATFAPGTHTASGSPSVGHATTSGVATFTAPVYTASGSPSVGHATCSGSALFATVVYQASGAPSIGHATSSGSASFTAPTYSGSGAPTVGHATASGSATFSGGGSAPVSYWAWNQFGMAL